MTCPCKSDRTQLFCDPAHLRGEATFPFRSIVGANSHVIALPFYNAGERIARHIADVESRAVGFWSRSVIDFISRDIGLSAGIPGQIYCSDPPEFPFHTRTVHQQRRTKHKKATRLKPGWLFVLFSGIFFINTSGRISFFPGLPGQRVLSQGEAK
jgi:hypothetical protein